MTSIRPSRLLKLALLADATVSATIATLHLSLAGPLTEWLILTKPLLIETGVFLVGFVALLLVIARRASVWAWLVRTIVLGNVGWALGCVALLALGAVTPSPLGLAFLAAHGVGVLGFALLEWIGLRASTPVNPSPPLGAY